MAAKKRGELIGSLRDVTARAKKWTKQGEKYFVEIEELDKQEALHICNTPSAYLKLISLNYKLDTALLRITFFEEG